MIKKSISDKSEIYRGDLMNMFVIVIEKKRNRMIEMAYQYGFTAKQTVKASQHLDKLLNLVQHSSAWESINNEKELTKYDDALAISSF
jgi:hypothetical protein